ncbi:MAG: M15 family metallopeptidase [Candidatus Eisenbacteria bacterium]|nr:M15 family metallopeptidase [Candidatus Eisenbacteria bacterium]
MYKRQVRGTPRQRYVASPSRGSMHNYGAAVDVTLIDASTGRQLDMGTPLDDFTILAAPREEDRLLRAGRLTREQVARRRLLRSVMTDAGFRALAIEWWHFDAFPKEETRRRFAIVE